MEARVQWVGGRTFVGESGSGHALVLGVAHEGKPAAGASAMEAVLIGTGTCTAFDVVLILEKGREPVDGCVVELDAERAEAYPQVFTRIHMRYIVSGRGLSRDKVERAVALSAEKYCAASAMLAHTAEITREIEIVDSADG